MHEVWLRTNTRALMLGMILPAILAAVGILLASGSAADRLVLGRFGWALVGISGLMILLLWLQMKQARLAYGDGHLLVRLRSGSPIKVPIDIVEAFFLGRGPSMLPGRRYQEAQTANLIIRLADRAGDWAQLEVKPALGSWCDGYITVRGTWCEPLDVSLADRLNRRLAEVKRAAELEPQP